VLIGLDGDSGPGIGGSGGSVYGVYLYNCSDAQVLENKIAGMIGGDGADGSYSGGNGGNATGIFLSNCANAIINGNLIAGICAGYPGYGYENGEALAGVARSVIGYNSNPKITHNEFSSAGIHIYIDLTSQPIIGGAEGQGNRFLNAAAKDYVIYNASPNDIDATWNFWECPPSLIDSLIYDYYDDSTKGIVHYDNSTDVEEEPVTQPPTLGSNLVNDVLHVSLSRDCAGAEPRLSLFDASGRRVLDQAIRKAQTSIDVSYLPQGVYFISVRPGEREHSIQKVIIY
jgi:hypothetical protein